MFQFYLILGSSDIHIMVIGPIIHLQLSMGSEISFAAGVLKSGETTQDQAGIVVDSPGACTGRHCLPFHKGGFTTGFSQLTADNSCDGKVWMEENSH